MIIGHTIAIAFGIQTGNFPVDVIFPCRESNCISSIVNPVGRESPLWIKLINCHNCKVVNPVLPGRIPFAPVDSFNFFQRTRKSVRNPPGEFTFFLFNKKLSAISFSIAIKQFALNHFVQHQTCPGFIVDLVLHPLVICFDRKLIPMIDKVAENTSTYLIGNLWLYIWRTWNPVIDRRSSSGILKKMNVLSHAVIAGFNTCILIYNERSIQSWLQIP